ncbi:fibronectin type-III domain-containing protein 3A-like isoform X2 [Spea bombifrons]|uniref:fibronectin type-III domain-containing protein 3A-like isoform X2 n=1 Tax=Spea bombifrons TaxID=233779 RepID=UPI00234A1D2B|nr:fibronectin type-III domain-containing protein 3A-like isoform X2 [Spea bombifrons]
MIISAMMADQPPPLEATPLLNEVSLLPHMVNGDSTQQVILVQVNPGETFTIRTEDGQIQCIQGPAHVPMVSPNGSVPPIFVPPGYMSQVVEENGVRKVLVLPHSADYHQAMHPQLSHIAHYIHHHPALLPHPAHPVYSPVPGTGEMPQFMHQPPPHPPHIYQEQEPRSHGRSSFIQREERAMKVPDPVRKRLKDRQITGHNNNKLNSPPSSPHKAQLAANAHIQNGYSKGQHLPGGPIKLKQAAKSRGSPPADNEAGDGETEPKKLQDFNVSVTKPAVSALEARSACLSWGVGMGTANQESPASLLPGPLVYEVAVSNGGKNGNFKQVYTGEAASCSLTDLRPATDYHVRVSATCPPLEGSICELVSFTTQSCEPDTPAAPRLTNRSRTWLNLQWKAASDNGSKINGFLLEWDEGKQGPFKECYSGYFKQYKLTKLTPSTKYAFRLAAKNDMGMSGFSETVVFYTSGSVPPTPLPPRLVQSGITWLSLEWSPPNDNSSDETLTYCLEMEEEGSGYGFKPKHNGEELTCTLKNLRRNTSYKFRVFAFNSEGRSNPSNVVQYATSPDRPGPPCKLSVKGKIHAHNVKVTWDAPKDNGGAEVSKYFLEISETSNGNRWDVIYSGSSKEHVCDHLKPGTVYRLRLYCANAVGSSQVSDILTVQTAVVPPGPCHPPRLAGKARPRDLSLQWAYPPSDGGTSVTSYTVEMAKSDQEDRGPVYQGPELECTVSNLLPGQTYSFWIKAANKAGCGPFSEKSEFCTAPGPPERCKMPLLSCKSANCILANWEAPMCNGSEITEYRLEWGRMEGCMQIVYTGSCPSYEIKGLTAATTYYCRVQAVNTAGAGLFGDTAVVTTPASVPAAVTSLHVLDGDLLETPLPSPSECLAIAWKEPCCNGSDITGYNIEYGEKQQLTVDCVTSCILENLIPDRAYRIRIQAINSLGAGPFSQSIKAKTKPPPPNPPHLECVVFSPQSLKLKWGDGSSKALATETSQFNLQMEDKLSRFFTIYNGPCHTYKVQRLNESTTYNFRIQAYNDAGEGPFSDVYSFATTKSPPSALKAPKVQQIEDNLCEVTWETLPPMRGDSIVYILQLTNGRETDQVYKGPETSFSFANFQTNCEYRFRVCAGRQFQDATGLQEVYGPYSPSTTFSSQRQELILQCANATTEATKTKRKPLTDEQFAILLLVIFAVVAFLFAVVIQYFVIK